MNEQNSPVTLELQHAHNNSPFPDEERGAGGLQFASPLPQSLAFSRAFLIQRKHPRQNKTSAICSISPCFLPQSRWLSTGACSASAEHWSISASNQNINCLNLETFDKLLTSCFAQFSFSVTCLFSSYMIHWHFMQYYTFFKIPHVITFYVTAWMHTSVFSIVSRNTMAIMGCTVSSNSAVLWSLTFCLFPALLARTQSLRQRIARNKRGQWRWTPQGSIHTLCLSLWTVCVTRRATVSPIVKWYTPAHSLAAAATLEDWGCLIRDLSSSR